MRPAYIVQITDTHIGPDRTLTRHGRASFPCAERLVSIINNLPQPPDAIVHTGDVTNDPDPAAYELAGELFANLVPPVYYVVGNHDRVSDIRKYLPMGPRKELGSEELLSYAFEVAGIRCLVLDARGPDEIDPHGRFSKEQLEIIHRELSPEGPPIAIFVHFPVWQLNSRWFDANMLITNGEELHTALVRAGSRVRGVFHGHIHMPMQCYRDGVLYSSADSSFARFLAWPGADSPELSPADPGFAFLQISADQTLVTHHSFARPDE